MTEPEKELAAWRTDTARQKRWLAYAALAVLAVALISGGGEDQAPAGDQSSPEEEADRPVAVARMSDAEIAECRETLGEMETAGLLRDRPSPEQIDVEDGVWAALPYRNKPMVLMAVSCDVFGTAMPPEGRYVRAVGYRSGERLMTLSHERAF